MSATPLRFLVPAMLAASLSSSLTAQFTVVVPDGTANAPGNSSNAFPWGNNASAFPGLRLMATYGAVNFTNQAVSTPILITGLKWRPNDTSAAVGGGQFNIATIEMSTSPVGQANVTTNFAGNHGADRTVVYDAAANGPIIHAPSPGAGAWTPQSWVVDVTLATPFLYDPTAGDLVVDVDYPTGTFAGAGVGQMDIQSTGSNSSRVFASTNYPAANGTTPNHGPVIEIAYVPPAGVYANFSANVQTGPSPLMVNFTDTSFSSPNAITSWAWDFENDGVVDSTVQNPSHTYTSCGEFDVSLTVTDSQNQSSTLVKSAFIAVDPLTADFTATPTFGPEPLIVNFTDTSTGGSAVPIMWEWDMDGDGVFDIMGTTPAEQNPVWVYLGGTYTVTLRTTFACTSGVGVVSETKTDLITCVGATTNTQGADLFEFQFNEVRGDQAFNAASTTAAPLSAAVSPSGWQVDAGRLDFQGNGPTGALGNSGLVATGHALDQQGSMTICWWQRLNTPPGTALAYVFGGSGGSFRCFTGGVAGNTLWYRGSSIGDVQASYDVQANSGVWEHVALVVDDTAGTADWYFNGVFDTSTSFTPGTHTATNTDYHVGYHTSTASIYTGGYDLDDYRHYNNALTPTEIAAIASGTEHAASTNYGSGCAGSAGTPSISASEAPDGSGPIGTPTYSVNLSGAEPNAGAFLAFGFLAGSNPLLPFDLGAVLGGAYAGCEIHTDASSALFLLTDASGSATVPLPIPGNGQFTQLHIYCQYMVLDSTVGSVSDALDVNIK